MKNKTALRAAQSVMVALLCAAMALPAAAEPCVHPATGLELDPYGDVNGSGHANIADAVCGILTSLWAAAPAGPPPPSCLAGPPELADTNCDGDVDIADVILLIRIALGSPLPAAVDTLGRGCADACMSSMPVIAATGGAITEFVANGTNGEAGVTYRVHTFTSVGSSTFTVTQASGDAAVEYLVVAGGGGGGGRHGGGGGAGGLLTNVGGSPLFITPQSYTVVVGHGGAGAPNNAGGGSDGGSSSFAGIVAVGGGGGGAHDGATAGRNGGSGGGGASHGRGLGTSGQGHAGGFGVSGHWNHGGGGGAGGPGQSGTTNTQGDGGPGLANAITGVTIHYAGGGGGGGHDPAATKRGFGGIGGGGHSGQPGFPNPGLNGTHGLGGGGGGSATSSGGTASSHGGNGGSGVVIIRYPISG